MLRDNQHFAPVGEPRVEASRHVAHQLEMLALVLADGHLLGSVGEDVGGLQNGVHQEAGRDQLPLGQRLVAELVHPLQATELRHRREQPRQLAVLLDVALAEENAALGVEPRREQDRGRVV